MILNPEARLFALLTTILLTNVASAANLEKMVAVQQAQLLKQQEQIKKLIAESEVMKSDISTCKNSDSKQKWTEGSMCVLANGACPAGFTRHEGHIAGISVYQNVDAAASYLTPVTFGSSSIGWHGRTPYRYGTWAGDLVLSTCCK